MSMTAIKSLDDLEGIKRRYREELSKYKYQVMVCGGTGCISSHCGLVKETLEKLVMDNQLQNQVAVIETGCMGLCAMGPVLLILPDEILYTEVNPSKMAEIFQSHILEGKVKEEYTFFDQALDQNVPKLSEIGFFKDQIKIALRNCGLIDYSSLEAYIARDGYFAVAKALQSMSDKSVLEEVQKAGLRERGGEGSLAGIQWEVGRNTKSDQKYIVCNADEGDPKAIQGKSILEGDPHCIIEGMMLAGYAMGATKGYVNVPAEYPEAAEHLGAAIECACSYGLLGANILGTNFEFNLEIRMGASAFVCGEDTSVLASMEGKRGEPKEKPPFPFEQGLFNKPTMIHNVETFAHVPPIILRGADWYAQYGTATAKGTKLLTLAGDILNKGMVEVPIGMSLGDLLFKIGGGIPDGKSFKAVQVGGPSGGCLSKEFLNTPIEDALTQFGGMMGSGGLLVMNEDTCMVDTARKFMEFLQDQSCGKCVPCSIGTKRMLEIVERITKGEGQQGDIELLEELGDSLQQSSMCTLGQTAPNPILSTIQFFREEYEEHLQNKYCRAGVCADLLISPCENACPAGINVPGYLALISVGKYIEAYELIKRENPFPAVCGRICTHPCESKCRRGQLDEPIAIADLKRFVSDYAFEHEIPNDKQRILPRNGKSIGIIGAGPSGLTCGYYLARLGYEVDVYESHSLAGGVLAFGIPEYRLPNNILTHEIKLIEQVGVNIHLNTKVGKDISFAELRKKHDAIYISTGSQISNKINVPGEELPGVVHGLDFLRAVNLDHEVQVGEAVVVIGGGNTAIDSARTALRMGAKKVRVLYRRALEDMPAEVREIYDAIEEGVEIMPLVAPLKFIGKEKLEEIECVRMELGLFDLGGRRIPVVKEGSNFTIKVDTVIPAVSQSSDLSFVNRNEVGVTQWGSLITDKDTLMTTLDGVFAGGDAARGSNVAIIAIADGKKVAVSMDRFLGGKGVLEKGEVIEFPPPTDEDDLLDHERYVMEILEADKRKSSFAEVGKGYHKLKAIAESMRCLRCDRR